MKKYVQCLSMICCLSLITSTVSASEVERKWGLRYVGSPVVKSVLTSNPSGQSSGRGSSFSILGEYYLPKKWSAEAGYFRTEVKCGYSERTMEGLQLGVKKYFVTPDFFLQPYVTTAMQFNWSSPMKEDYVSWYELHSIVASERYDVSVNLENPRLSFAPGVGAEFYLLSPIAFVARYSFNIGLGSNTNVEVLSPSGQGFRMKDKGMYHNLELGVKITFPFRFTDEDSSSILNAIKQGFGLD